MKDYKQDSLIGSSDLFQLNDVELDAQKDNQCQFNDEDEQNKNNFNDDQISTESVGNQKQQQSLFQPDSYQPSEQSSEQSSESQESDSISFIESDVSSDSSQKYQNLPGETKNVGKNILNLFKKFLKNSLTKDQLKNPEIKKFMKVKEQQGKLKLVEFFKEESILKQLLVYYFANMNYCVQFLKNNKTDIKQSIRKTKIFYKKKDKKLININNRL